MKSVSFVLLLLFWAGSLRAQSAVVEGSVVQSGDGLPLSAARLTLLRESDGAPVARTLLGRDGAFKLKFDPPAGGARYSLKVSHTGFETREIAGLELAPGDHKHLQVSLLLAVINLNPVVVTPSRRDERMLEAPAQVSVIDSARLQSHAALTPTDQLAIEPGLDLAATGLNHQEVALRGFNGIYNGNTRLMLDDRDIRLPNFRINVMYDMPTAQEDIESVELVSGPAAALYGANSAYGVIHYRTRSPFDSPGTRVSLAAGERGVLEGELSTSARFNDKLAGRVSFRHFQGRDWHSSDQAEPDSLRLTLPTATGSRAVSGYFPNRRDYGLSNSAFDARLDWRPQDDLALVLSGGLTRSDIFNVTNQGALQADGFMYGYFQTRLDWRNLFVQAYLNANSSNDGSYGYFLRNGLVIIDKSKAYAAQVRQSVPWSSHWFTWGADAAFTRPETRNTFHGRNEDHDNIAEYGLYAQNSTRLSRQLEFLAAGRLDKHNRLAKIQFSPRAALTWSPAEGHNLRLTFNRAFTAPNTPRLFWDFQAGAVDNPFAPLDPSFRDELVSLRVSGVPLSGYHFPRGADGLPLMDSQFDEVSGWSAPSVNSAWPGLRKVLVAQDPRLDAVLPVSLGAVAPTLYRDLFNGRVMADVKDIDRLRPERTSTLELGLKSLLGTRMLLSASLWRSEVRDFVAFTYTPAVFADPAALASVLGSDIAARLTTAGLPPDQAAAQAAALAAQLTQQIAALPLGVVAPREAESPVEVYRTNRNFGRIAFWGAETGLELRLGESWALQGSYSFVNRNLFRNVDGIQDIPLNAPRHKFALGGRWHGTRSRLSGGLRLRHVGGFPAQDGVYSGTVDSYTLLDLDAGWRLPAWRSPELTLSVSNLLDNRHREFPYAPELGRLALLRLSYRY